MTRCPGDLTVGGISPSVSLMTSPTTTDRPTVPAVGTRVRVYADNGAYYVVEAAGPCVDHLGWDESFVDCKPDTPVVGLRGRRPNLTWYEVMAVSPKGRDYTLRVLDSTFQFVVRVCP